MKKTGALLSALFLSTVGLQAPLVHADTANPADNASEIASNRTKELPSLENSKNIIQENNVSEKKDSAVLNKNQVKPTLQKSTATPVKEKILASGKYGTSPWYLDDAGFLHFGTGEFPKRSLSPDNSPFVNADIQNYTHKIVLDGPIKAPKDSSFLLEGLPGSSIEHLERLDTSQVENMESMFDSNVLKNIDLSSWDTSKVKNMKNMFKNVSADNINLANINTANVEIFDGMFEANRVKELNLSGWDTRNAISMKGMFKNTHYLRKIVLGPKFKFVVDSSNPNQGTTELPSQGKFVNHKWQNIDLTKGGTDKDPKGENIWRPSEFEANFNKDPQKNAGTYVWNLSDAIIPGDNNEDSNSAVPPDSQLMPDENLNGMLYPEDDLGYWNSIQNGQIIPMQHETPNFNQFGQFNQFDSSAKKLPETGDQSDITVLIVGLVAIGVGLLTLYGLREKKNKF